MGDPNNSGQAIWVERVSLSCGIAWHWFVIAGLTRNPVFAPHWIPDVGTPDPGSSPGQALIRGRDDHLASELSDDLPVLRETRQQVLTPRQTEISKIKTRCHRAAGQ